jgi:tartrate dehydratase beta subunit/fumarate hydratase class I family protein
MAVGGAAAVSKAIKSSRIVAFADLGMERSTNSTFATCR